MLNLKHLQDTFNVFSNELISCVGGFCHMALHARKMKCSLNFLDMHLALRSWRKWRTAIFIQQLRLRFHNFPFLFDFFCGYLRVTRCVFGFPSPSSARTRQLYFYHMVKIVSGCVLIFLLWQTKVSTERYVLHFVRKFWDLLAMQTHLFNLFFLALHSYTRW